ncbi:hypothetical protein SAMN04515674_10623 [Pseudarcicella hirudinis]|uniref:Uncharacterized protein n=1 Tax=Pseudarcicella hirudinis TaxID=1079859 RepID=A0A1I5TG98_9BACT|nr:hypothetical protein [Pseudarcicella hirudinis]SFP81697.1 hypothetical protein SAMN04515674_10623 [Pseudarcicella hirudinis]
MCKPQSEIPVLMLFDDGSDPDIKKHFLKLKEDYPDLANYLLVNTTEYPVVAKSFHLSEKSTLVATISGKEYWRHSGDFTIELVKRKIAVPETIC